MRARNLCVLTCVNKSWLQRHHLVSTLSLLYIYIYAQLVLRWMRSHPRQETNGCITLKAYHMPIYLSIYIFKCLRGVCLSNVVFLRSNSTYFRKWCTTWKIITPEKTWLNNYGGIVIRCFRRRQILKSTNIRTVYGNQLIFLVILSC